MINLGFWKDLKHPILCLAPMADVTDVAFRYIIARYSKKLYHTQNYKSQGEPLTYVTYTEFVSADGLVRAPEKGRKKLLKDLEYSEIERPIVAQFFTSNPEHMKKAAGLAVELGFDGVDINMGCPDRKVEKQNAGAALIKNPLLARQLIKAAKEGTKNKIPVSVKTRLGYNKDELETWLPELLAENPAAIIIHARTRKEMSKVPARWERIKRAVEIRDQIQTTPSPTLPLRGREFGTPSPLGRGQGGGVKTLIIGNGDVEDVNDAKRKCEKTGADGVMLGRAIFGTPWLFSNSRELENKENSKVVRKILEILVEHTKLFEEKIGETKNFSIMKKHFKSYLSGIPNTSELREKLMLSENSVEVDKVVQDFLLYNK